MSSLSTLLTAFTDRRCPFSAQSFHSDVRSSFAGGSIALPVPPESRLEALRWDRRVSLAFHTPRASATRSPGQRGQVWQRRGPVALRLRVRELTTPHGNLQQRQMAAIEVELIGVSAAQQLLESPVHSCHKAINREHPGLVFSLSFFSFDWSRNGWSICSVIKCSFGSLQSTINSDQLKFLN